MTGGDGCRQAPRRDSEVIKCVGNMWWNPKLPADARPIGSSRAQGGESALAPLARDMAASQAGSRCVKRASKADVLLSPPAVCVVV